MHGHGNLELFLIFLLAAVIAVPLFRRFGLGAVLGYLFAGAVMGPYGFKMVEDPASILAFSELGVVMLLFVIGLELSPARLWLMRRQVFGIGGLQMGLTACLIGGLAVFWTDGWKAQLVVGIGLALSSTAVGLQILGERKELASGFGRLSFAILLFQDLAAIPLLAVIPLLGKAHAAAQSAPSFDAVMQTIGMLALVMIGGRFALRHLFRVVAWTEMSEVFTATALLVVVGAAWLMQYGGLSMGLGAFLAGVLLADSEFRHELEAQIEPFKGLLLGLFFISVGMTIDLHRVLAEPWLITSGVATLLAIKMVVLIAIGWRPGALPLRESLMLGGVLALGGEFAFVVFGEAYKHGLLEQELRDRLVAIVGLSMAVTPLLVIAVARLAATRMTSPAETRPTDAIDLEHPRVIIAGYGRMGQIIGRMLRAQKIPFTALETSAEQVDNSRRFGHKIYFGDPTRPDLLRAAHVDRAEVFVLTTDNPDITVRTARLLKRQYPHLKIFARARNRQHAYRLMDLGVEITRETFFSSLMMGQHVMEALGVPREVAVERRERFREHDEAVMQEQHLVYDDEAALIASSHQALVELETLYSADSRVEAKRSI